MQSIQNLEAAMSAGFLKPCFLLITNDPFGVLLPISSATRTYGSSSCSP
jgi:hypothetical protein